MISLQEEIEVARAPRECFDYVADFRNTPQWDATAKCALKLSSGPLGPGTVFHVWVSLPLGRLRIHYQIVEFEPPLRISLSARCWLFDAVDTVHFTPGESGTHISYRADFSYRQPLAALESSLQPGMLRMGKKSMRGLARALEDDFPAPRTSPGNARADRLVWPGLALFSKLGYRRGQRHWNPVSSSLRGRHMVLTGASSGLGLASARELAGRGADLTLVMRNPERAEAVVEELIAETGNPGIRAEIADLSLMRDVDALIARLGEKARPIDVLINNAGALYKARRETDEGLEASFALLLLSPYRLTLGLHPLLAAARGSRVINVVSGGMYSQKLVVRELQAGPENYSGAVAYARCKRALTVLSEEWARAWADDGIVVNAMHPGWADTPGVESSLPGFHRLTRYILRSPEEGADTIVWLAAAREAAAVSGRLFLDREPRTTHLLSRTRETPGGARSTSGISCGLYSTGAGSGLKRGTPCLDIGAGDSGHLPQRGFPGGALRRRKDCIADQRESGCTEHHAENTRGAEPLKKTYELRAYGAGHELQKGKQARPRSRTPPGSRQEPGLRARKRQAAGHGKQGRRHEQGQRLRLRARGPQAAETAGRRSAHSAHKGGGLMAQAATEATG